MQSEIIRPNAHKMEKGHFSGGGGDTRFTKAVKAPNNFSSFSDFMGGRRCRRSGTGSSGCCPTGEQQGEYRDVSKKVGRRLREATFTLRRGITQPKTRPFDHTCRV